MTCPNERASWTEEETMTLITLWEEHLSGLRGQKRNAKIYSAITEALARYGIVRTRAQVHTKIENLRSKYRLFSKNRTTGSGAVTWPFYWRIHQFLGSLPVNDASLAVESNCESLSVSQIVRSMETGSELSELEPLGSEAEIQLVIEMPESSSATVATSTANLEQTAATGLAETAAPAVESLPQCSESSPAEAGATAAQPAASKKKDTSWPRFCNHGNG
ncbi:hypothetical protein MRX96_058827 [Rhipicephalus microplus]|uniref:uncharacterized protein LOC119178798 n=1 Tax=Rhipicephalus microplus TaxID=6941 RepID=UPI003F6B7FF4